MSNIQAINTVIDRNDLPSLFLENDEKNRSKLIPIIEMIEIESKKIVFDIKTDDGKQGIRSLAFNIAKAKTAIENAGKEKKSELSVEIKIVDGLRNVSKDRLGKLQEEIRRPLTDLENAEKERIGKIELRLENLSAMGNENMTSDELLEAIKIVTSSPIDDSWDEFKADAIKAHESTLTRLNLTYQKIKKLEDEKAELDQLRAMRIEFEKRESERLAADKARLEAEAKAEAQAEKVRLDHQLQIEAAKLEAQRQADEAQRQIEAAKLEAQRQEYEAQRQIEAAKLEAQRQIEAAKLKEKFEADQKRLESEQLKRNKAARDMAMADSVEDLVTGGIPITHAKKVIKLIYENKVIHVDMKF